jgi:hypothetical protein
MLRDENQRIEVKMNTHTEIIGERTTEYEQKISAV